MYNPLLPILILGYILSLIISILSIIYITTRRETYGINLITLLTCIVIFNIGVLYSTFYVFSIIFYFSDDINIILWKISILLGFLSLEILCLVYNFLIEYKKIQIIPLSYFTILFGLLIGNLFIPDSIRIKIDSPNSSSYLIFNIPIINYSFNFISELIVIVFQISIVLYFFYISIKLHLNVRIKKFSRVLIMGNFVFLLACLMYILYITFQLTLFRDLHIIFVWIGFSGICIMTIKNPLVYLVLTNKIYNINIYHKSGILLYSYKFEKVDITDSAIWGNIIIGINHILSEFIDKRNQIDVLQTKNTEIIINYDNEYGFAVLVITNKRNIVLESIILNFINEFRSKYSEELTEIQDINRIINVSEFKGIKSIIERNFKLYL